MSMRSLLKKKGVVSVGRGYKFVKGKKTPTIAVVCGVEKKLPPLQVDLEDMIPSNFKGDPTDVIEVGIIRAGYPIPQEHTQRERPARCGLSIGHYKITAGTQGCIVTKNGKKYILSNNHVLANSNAGAIGDPIYQPGPYDGGGPDEQIAALAEFVQIIFAGSDLPSDCKVGQAVTTIINKIPECLNKFLPQKYKFITRLKAISPYADSTNLVDAALALPIVPDLISPEIIGIGISHGLGTAQLGIKIKKTGRTTELTSGEILQVNVTVNVQYGAGQVAIFEDQLLAGAMSAGGDSGSAVIDDKGRIIGLLFAGSDSATIINRIENVRDALGFTL